MYKVGDIVVILRTPFTRPEWLHCHATVIALSNAAGQPQRGHYLLQVFGSNQWRNAIDEFLAPVRILEPSEPGVGL